MYFYLLVTNLLRMLRAINSALHRFVKINDFHNISKLFFQQLKGRFCIFDETFILRIRILYVRREKPGVVRDGKIHTVRLSAPYFKLLSLTNTNNNENNRKRFK